MSALGSAAWRESSLDSPRDVESWKKSCVLDQIWKIEWENGIMSNTNSRSVCASTKSHQGLHCMCAESLYNVDYVDDHDVRKRNIGHMRAAEIQIRLCIRAVWSESLLSAFWIAMNAMFSSSGQLKLIRLRGCTGWIECSLDARVRSYVFSRYGL